MATPNQMTILPRHIHNPIGHARMVNQAVAHLNRGIDEVQRWTIERFNQFPRQEITVNATRYEYLIDPNALQDYLEQIRQRTLAATADQMVADVVRSYEVGTADEIANLSSLTDQYTRTIDTVFLDTPHQTRVGLMRARVFEEMVGFAGETGKDLAVVLGDAINAGENPLEVARRMRARFDVSRSRAERIARTEMLMAMRRGALDENQDAEQRLNIQTRMLHLSALKPGRTRPWHADRHGNTYTRQEVKEFYATGANPINCLCAVKSVLVDDEGQIRSEVLRKRLAKQKERFVAANPR